MNPFEILVEHCNESHPHMESPRGQIDIAKAKAEHTALLAVAEAAKEIKVHFIGERNAKNVAGESGLAAQRFQDALATLAQIQKGE